MQEAPLLTPSPKGTVIALTNAGKRFGYEWIFRRLTYRLEAGQRYGLAGPNGSGKSTLMRILSGHLSLSQGEICFQHNGQKLGTDLLYRHVSMAAPYIELIEELTLRELVFFHSRLRPFRKGLSAKEVIDLLGMRRVQEKPLRFFSSGMKQRVRLALALCTEAGIVLLDEPTTNLDAEGIRWFHNLFQAHSAERLVVVASNILEDLQLCAQILSVFDYK